MTELRRVRQADTAVVWKLTRKHDGAGESFLGITDHAFTEVTAV